MRQLTIALTLIVTALAPGAMAVAKENAVAEAAKVNVKEATASKLDSKVLVGGEQPKAIMFHDKDVLTVSVLNNSKAKVVFRIKDNENSVVFSSRSKDMVYHKRLSTKSMDPGKYKAEVLKGKEVLKLDFTVL